MSGLWADQEQFMKADPEAANRRSPGLSPSQREAKWIEQEQFLFHYVDPDYFGGYTAPPPELEAVFTDIYHEWKKQQGDLTLKLRFSQTLKRWCLYHLCWHP